MTPGLINFVCPQGATFKRTFFYSIENDDGTENPIDLTGYEGKLQVRQAYYSIDPLLTLATSGSGITLSGSSGSISIYISHEDTSALPVGTHVYDLELIHPSLDRDRLIEGTWHVTPEVTR